MPETVGSTIRGDGMPAAIQKSVGHGGVNAAADVRVIQQLLQGFARQEQVTLPRLDGVIDQATLTAIVRFQAKVMKIAAPDGRVDPGGRTITALGTFAASLPAEPANPEPAVTYGQGVPPAVQLVSDYAIKVIRKALRRAGMSAGVITSTLRPPQEQAAIMYKNAALDLGAQFALYGPTGDEILKVYQTNQNKPKADVITLMRKKIEAQLAAGKQVSRHVTTEAQYRALNVIDIGINSTREAAGSTFHPGKLTEAFSKLQAEGYIRKFIDETAKSNKCWHLEIVPDDKPL